MKKIFSVVTALLLCLTTGYAQQNNAVERNIHQNQAELQLLTNENVYYNTADLQSIDLDGDIITVNTRRQQSDVYQGNVQRLAFLKRATTISIIEAKGWYESAYATFTLTDAADNYNVYILGGSYQQPTLIDAPLVRSYGTYGRIDMVGLPAGSYTLQIVPVSEGVELPDLGITSEPLEVKGYDRAGFAHHNYQSGVGAYNNDGTLKSGARVLYVTRRTAKTVTQSVVTSSKGGITECTGLQAIIDAYQKGYDTTPLDVRIIGCVSASDMDALSSSEIGLQVKGKSKYSPMNITVEGIGDDATIYGFGILVRNCTGIEIRNLGFMQYPDDGISLDTDNSNIWIHHNDFFYGKKGSGDKAKGDGSVDAKANTMYTTISYNHFWDTGKSSMVGMKNESGPNFICLHHNWFDHSDSRHARIRTMSVHIWNNYYDQVAKYGVGACTGSSVFVESNYFLKTKKPILSSNQGTDALGSGTFSGEDGGMIKAYGNHFDRTVSNFRYYTQQNPASTGYDAYETATRNEQVPATEVTRAGGTSYNNFDTDPDLMYAYTADAADDIPDIVKGYWGAGRLNHGDFSYSFADNTGDEEADSSIDSAYAALLIGYQSALVGGFDETPTDPGNEDPGNDNPVVTPTDDVIFCTFDKNGTPSNSFFTVTDGNGSNSKGVITVDEQVISTCLKMETYTSISFTLQWKAEMTLYFGPEETASIKIDGAKIEGSGNIYTTTLEAGNHELKKDKSVNLFAIKIVRLTD